MKLLTMKQGSKSVLGVKVAEGIVDVSALATKYGLELELTMEGLIQRGAAGVSDLQRVIGELSDAELAMVMVDEAEVIFEPAITNPGKIICIGLNYRKHADETKLPYPDYPILFNKFNNALTGHLSEVVVPKTTKRLDYEVELGIVMGKQAKYVSEAAALDYVFGYCTTNDLSARDLQKRSSQWLLGKTNDGFAPVGPYIVPRQFVGNPDDLRVTTKLNGKVRQDSTTADMIFNCASLISYISQHMTLEPGDLIMTGTPEGVIIGRPMAERTYLQAGDKVTVEVEGLGALTNYFIAE